MKQRPRILASLALAAALAACGAADPSKFITSAESYMAKRNYPAAVIELKNALAAAPDNAKARFMLGTALEASGDPVGAATELRKAAALGAAPDDVYPLLARAVTQQQQVSKADIAEIEAAGVTSAHAKAQIAAMMGNAYLALGQPAEAKTRIDAALDLEPANVDARIARAHAYAADKDFLRAGRVIDEVLAANPDNVDALAVKSDLELATGNSRGAAKTLEHVVELSPRALRARYMLASLYVQANEIDNAAKQVDVLTKIAPSDAHTLHAVGMIAFARGDNRAALDAVQKSLEIAPNYLPARYLSGLIDLGRGAYAAAEQTLRAVVAQSPQDDGAGISLSQAQLRRGEMTQADETLATVLRRSPDNVAALRLAAEIEVARRSPGKAAEYIARANSLDVNNLNGKVRLAEVRLAKGDTAQGMRDLESLSLADKDAPAPDIALVAAHMRARDYPKALQAADTIIAKNPKSPIGYNTKGAVYTGMGDLPNARAQFDKALAQDGKFLAASYGLARIDTAERKFDSAKARYQSIIDTMPQSEVALLGLAEVLRDQGAPTTEVVTALSRAIAANPESIAARIALVNYYMQLRNWKLALTAAQAAQAAIPDSPALLEALAAAQTGAGESNQAIETYVRLAKLHPENPMAAMRLAAIETSRKNFDAALEYLTTARAAVPDSPTIVISLASAYRDAGKIDAGLAEARRLQKESPKRPFGYALEAELYALDNKPADAVVAYRAALARDPAALTVMRYYDLLGSLGKTSDATALVTQWIAQHPQDVIVRTVLGQRSLDAGDCATAARYYREAITYDGSNVALLNNLAWCLSETRDPAALDYAERAYRLAPGSAAVANTYGWILVQRGDTARGIESLRRAIALDPNESARRLYLAKALIKSGDKAGARKELETVAGSGGNSQAEAQQLLTGL